MAGASMERPPRGTIDVERFPGLNPGDHLDQPTFHALYERMPEDFKAELIGGIVMIPGSVSEEHGGLHALLSGWLGVYQAATPGTRALTNTTIILGPDSEPQPDCALLIEAESGGQSRVEERNETQYRVGPPELIVEVAYSTAAHDRFEKYRDYKRAGVKEYAIAVLHDRRLEWHAARDGRFEPLPAGGDGILRSEVFPGLWLDPAALFRGDSAEVLNVLRRGLDSAEHAEFTRRLQARRTR